jgi:hypothetical protein
LLPWLGAAAVAGATALRVYRGGTTLNDHLVAAVVLGCIGIYPLLWTGARGAGIDGTAALALGIVLGLGAVSIYGLFHVLDGRRDPGGLIWVARASQPALAFALWAGLLLVLRAPWAFWSGAPPTWPGALLALPAALALWGTAWTFAGGRVREHPVPIPDLAAPVRIAHLSDLHVGPTMRRADLDALVARVDALAPDLVVVTGDFLTPFSEGEHAFLLDALAALRVPVYACLGNHDLPVAARLAEELAGVGVHLLVDASAVIAVRGVRIELVGVDFHWRGARGHLAAALAGLPPAPADVRVLLAHDPRLFAWVPEARFDLALAGHTHGGQVGTDMFGLPGSALRPLGVFDQGWWRRGRARLYVHRGNWSVGLPPRMGIAPEIAVHHLINAAGLPEPPGDPTRVYRDAQPSSPPQGA